MAVAIFYPTGRDGEAKALAQKLEILTPKFTKVAFRLRTTVMEAYDPKSDWRDPLLAKVTANSLRLVFLVVDRPLDDARRKPLAAELDRKKIYFQDVPLLSIEKKAFYTDLLLGLVFFFDTNRPASENG